MATLTEYLKSEGITQAQFASRVGVTQGYIAKLCAGLATPRLVMAYKIERETAGAVPVSFWLEDAEAKGATS